MSYWILVDRRPVKENDFEKWRLWYQSSETILRQDEVLNVPVVTLFIGQVSDGDPDPHLFVSVVQGFEGKHPVYKTWEAAHKGHMIVLRDVAESIALNN